MGAVCGKAARTVLGGGRVMKHASLPLRRRTVITMLGGAAIAWPLGGCGRSRWSSMRRIGVLMTLVADNAEAQARNTAFLQSLQELGWTDRRSVRIDTRWGAGDADLIRKYARIVFHRLRIAGRLRPTPVRSATPRWHEPHVVMIDQARF